jgi:hypothetical protein
MNLKRNIYCFVSEVRILSLELREQFAAVEIVAIVMRLCSVLCSFLAPARTMEA